MTGARPNPAFGPAYELLLELAGSRPGAGRVRPAPALQLLPGGKDT
ncbi:MULTISPECIES: hypothetical protein [Streptomyces]|nr:MULTISPECIES: hypothetical protein [unclassified Streptomyces]NMI54512.1 hypothetical protein [Streptomyces sp. RLA2-12]